MKKIEFLEKARNIHGYKYEYVDLPYRLILNDSISLIFNGELFTQKVSKHLMGKCPEKAVKKKTTDDFIKESKLIWGDKYDYSLTEYTGALNNIKVIYDGIVYEQRASSHLEGMSPEFRKNEEVIIREKIKDSNREGNKEIEDFLNKYKVDYKKYHQINLLTFDYYLVNIRTFIEFKGRHHFEPISEFGGFDMFNSIKIDDKKKEDYCEENYINLIKIRYDQIDDIYQILWNNLRNFIKN